jgi:putative transposase
MKIGYNYDKVRALRVEFRFTAHSRACGQGAHALKQEAGFKAQRWVVDHTKSCMLYPEWQTRFLI